MHNLLYVQATCKTTTTTTTPKPTTPKPVVTQQLMLEYLRDGKTSEFKKIAGKFIIGSTPMHNSVHASERAGVRTLGCMHAWVCVTMHVRVRVCDVCVRARVFLRMYVCLSDTERALTYVYMFSRAGERRLGTIIGCAVWFAFVLLSAIILFQ